MCAQALYLWISSQAHSTSFYQWKGLCLKSKHWMDPMISLTVKLHVAPQRSLLRCQLGALQANSSSHDLHDLLRCSGARFLQDQGLGLLGAVGPWLASTCSWFSEPSLLDTSVFCLQFGFSFQLQLFGREGDESCFTLNDLHLVGAQTWGGPGV